ncbi:hypothetical protein D3C86_1685220 [compost metagenome]
MGEVAIRGDCRNNRCARCYEGVQRLSVAPHAGAEIDRSERRARIAPLDRSAVENDDVDPDLKLEVGDHHCEGVRKRLAIFGGGIAE